MSILLRRKKELIIGPDSGIRENVQTWQRLRALKWEKVHRIKEIAIDIAKHERQDVAVVLVMGAPGTGKSSFIRTLTGHLYVESKKNAVVCSEYFTPDGRRVRLIDTPGYYEWQEDITNADILTTIGECLVTEYRHGRKLSGVIYMHDISRSRFGVPRLSLLQKLVGEHCFSNVLIVTTKWDAVNPATGRISEEDLKSTLLKPLTNAGARVVRHDSGLKSAQEIIDIILGQVPKVLLLQEELTRPGTCLADTSVGAKLAEDFARSEEEVKDQLKELEEKQTQAQRVESLMLTRELLRNAREKLQNRA